MPRLASSRDSCRSASTTRRSFARTARGSVREADSARSRGLGALDPKATHGDVRQAIPVLRRAVIGGGPAGLAAAARGGAGRRRVDPDRTNGRSSAARSCYGRFDGERRHRPTRGGPISSRRRAAQPGLGDPTATPPSPACSPTIGSRRSRATASSRSARGQIVLATGSFEQPLVFRNNDLPGIMFAAAAQRLMRLYGVRPGQRAVVVTANATATRRRSTSSMPGSRWRRSSTSTSPAPARRRSDARRHGGIRVLTGLDPRRCPRQAPCRGGGGAADRRARHGGGAGRMDRLRPRC